MKNFKNIYNNNTFKYRKEDFYDIGLMFSAIFLVFSIVFIYLHKCFPENFIGNHSIEEIKIMSMAALFMAWFSSIMYPVFVILSCIRQLKLYNKKLNLTNTNLEVNYLLNLYKKSNPKSNFKLFLVFSLYMFCSIFYILTFITIINYEIQDKAFEIKHFYLTLCLCLTTVIIVGVAAFKVSNLIKLYNKKVKKIINKKNVSLYFYNDNKEVYAKSIKEIIKLLNKGYTCDEAELKKILLT